MLLIVQKSAMEDGKGGLGLVGVFKGVGCVR